MFFQPINYRNSKINKNDDEVNLIKPKPRSLAASQVATGLFNLNNENKKFLSLNKRSVTKKTSIKDQNKLIEKAKIAAAEFGSNLSQSIHEYGIDGSTREGQRGLIEIAKISAAESGGQTSQYIENYGIDGSTEEGQRALIEIAKIAAQSNGITTSQYIENYGIDGTTREGQRGLIKIAKKAAQCSGQGTSQYIKNYGIDGRAEEGLRGLIKIAKFAAQSSGKGTSQYIKNYGFDGATEGGRRVLLEVAKIAAAQNGDGTSKHIQNYGFDGRAEEGLRALIEVAKIAAAQSGAGTSRFINHYGFDGTTEEGLRALTEVAAISATQNGYGTSCYIQNYGFNYTTKEGLKTLIEIAKIAASGYGSSEYIQNYGIDVTTEEGQRELIEIAKIAAAQDGSETSRHIQNYGIDGTTEEGQRELIEIAKIAAAQDGCNTSALIKNYGIDGTTEKGLRGLIEIAKIAAAQSGGGTALYIQNYKIDGKTEEGQRALIEIARIAALQDGENTSFYIQNFGIDVATEKGQREILEILIICLRSSWKTYKAVQSYFSDSNMKLPMVCYALSDILQKAAAGGEFRVNIDDSFFNEILKSLFPETVTLENNKIRKNNIYNFAYGIEKLVEKEWPESKIAPNMLKQIVDLKKPEEMELREFRTIQVQQFSLLLKALADCFILDRSSLKESSNIQIVSSCLKLQDPKLREDLWNLLFENKLSFKLAQKTPNHVILPSIPLHCLEMDQEMAAIVQTLKDKRKNIIFKDASLHKQLLKTLITLYKEPSLTKTDKANLIRIALSFRVEGKFGDKNKIYKALQLIKGIIDLDGSAKLKDANDESCFIPVLEQIYLEAFKKIVPIKTDKSSFGEKFERMQNTFRTPNALMIYASSLKKLGAEKEVIMSAFASLLEKVLVEENFPKSRYEDSAHLDLAFAGREALKSIWEAGEKRPLLSILKSPKEKEDTIDFQKQLLHSFKEKHVKKQSYPELYRFLKNPSDSSIVIDLKERLEGASKEVRNKIILQMQLIELAKGSSNSMEALKHAIKRLPKENEQGYEVQFDADIKGLYKSLREKAKKEDYSNWTIEDTDSFEDLFLCGTEVANSCQNINNDPNLNKCLLAYVMDGKNRLIAIKDSRGKIRARAILRLLLKSGEPVLFIERIYPRILKAELSQALQDFAIQRSSSLNLQLLSKEVGKGRSMSEELISLGSKAPYEYVDAGMGVKKEGKFSIFKAHILND